MQLQKTKSKTQNPPTGQPSGPKSKERVGRTAYFTAAVWAGLGVKGAGRFVTRRGLLLKAIVERGGALFGLIGPYSVTNLFLAARHLWLDRRLDELAPAQVIELAAGFSARGIEWAGRQAGGVYLEIDQPAIVAAKQKILAKDRPSLAPGATYRLAAADLVTIEAAELVRLVLPLLDPARPTLIIAEGITGYLAEPAFSRLLDLLYQLAAAFDQPTILLDCYLKLNFRRHGRVAWAMLPPRLIWQVLRAPMRMFVEDEAQIRSLLEKAGFEVSELWPGQELAARLKLPRPAVNLYYVAQIRKLTS